VSGPEDGAVRLGCWARAGELVGVVAAVDEGGVALFDPAARRTARVPAGEVTPLPAGAVRVTVTVDLPVAHGVAEADLRRWVAALTDEVLRGRAAEALRAAGLDEGAALAGVELAVTPPPGDEAICLAGHRSPAPGACTTCGRDAAAPATRQQAPDVFGAAGLGPGRGPGT